MPSPIPSFDQGHSFCATPPLDFFFPSDRSSDIAIHLEVHEAVNSITSSESRHKSFPMLRDSADQIVGHPRIEDSRPACQNIDVVQVLHARTLKADPSLRSG